MTDADRPDRRRDGVRYALERQVAPHVDPRWAEALLLELRLRGVPGRTIGEVLAEVDAHCVESGETAAAAFGDAAAYGRSLDLPTDDDLSPRELFPALVRGTLQALGLLATVFGVGAWAAGEPLVITVGMLCFAGGLLLAELVLLRYADTVLRAALLRSWAPAVGFFIAVSAAVVVLVLADQEVATVPGAWAALLGLCRVASGQVLVLRAGTDAGVSDAIVPPLGPAPAPSRTAGLLMVAATWSIPLWTVLLAGLTWWLATLT